MPDNDLFFATAAGLSRLLRARKISAVELTRVFLDRLATLGPRYNALAELTPELALRQARRADRILRRSGVASPLMGVPYGAKDLLATKGIPTRWGAPPYRNQVFDYDATVVRRLRDCNAPAGKSISLEALRSALKSQYHATLAMLRSAIRQCPDDLWTSSDGHASPFWLIAYHALFYTHLYLQPNNGVFGPWEHHQRGIQHMDRPPRTKWRPYTKAEVLAYWKVCDSMVDGAVDALNLNAPHSGFSWYKILKLEHQIVNIRHIQYHEAQLGDRLRSATGAGVGWADARRSTRARPTSRRQHGKRE